MFRVLSNGLAALGLAAIVAFVALTGGSAPNRAEAAVQTVDVAITPTVISCGYTASVTATVTDSVVNAVNTVTFTTTAGSITPSASTVNGVATAVLQAVPYNVGTITVTATAGGISDTVTATINCGTFDPCYQYGAYNCYNNCGYYAQYNCNNNCYYNGVYTPNCNIGNCYNAGCINNCTHNNIYNCGTASACITNAYLYNNPCGTVCAYNYTYSNLCSPVAPTGPSRITILPGATSVSCGSATSITVTVVDSAGYRVADGTNVSFSTTLGYISSSDSTLGGTAVTSLTIPTATSGPARVTATAGGVSADTTINVSCSAGSPAIAAVPAQVAIQLPAVLPTTRPAILPPSTGDAGLAN